jgi:hypothetical protein
MIDPHAPQIVSADGDTSSEMIEPCSAKASQKGLDDQETVQRTSEESRLGEAPCDRDQTVARTVSSAGHVSGLTLQHPHSTGKETTASSPPVVHHVSGTIFHRTKAINTPGRRSPRPEPARLRRLRAVGAGGAFAEKGVNRHRAAKELRSAAGAATLGGALCSAIRRASGVRHQGT